MARGTGKRGPDPWLGYTPTKCGMWLSAPARDLLKKLAEQNGQSNGAYVMSLLAREADMSLDELKRDYDQEVLPKSA